MFRALGRYDRADYAQLAFHHLYILAFWILRFLGQCQTGNGSEDGVQYISRYSTKRQHELDAYESSDLSHESVEHVSAVAKKQQLEQGVPDFSSKDRVTPRSRALYRDMKTDEIFHEGKGKSESLPQSHI